MSQTNDDDRNLPALIDRARFRLAKARTSAEVMEVRREATAAYHISRWKKYSDKVHEDWLRIIDRADYLISQKLNELEKHKGGRPRKNLSEDTTGLVDRPTLAELGITRDESAYLRKRRVTDEAVIEQVFEQAREEGRSALMSDIKHAVAGAAPRERKRKKRPKKDIIDQYHVDETGGWLIHATRDFWNAIIWDDELVPEDYTRGDVMARAITVTRNRDTGTVTISIPSQSIHTIIPPSANTVAFQLIKFKMPDEPR